MSSKMNWDRVRKESLVHRHGSERACNEPEEVILKGPNPRPLMPGCTCGKQTRELEEYCQRRGWEVAGCYVDTGISGSKDSRPELDWLMADAHRRRFDAIAV